MESKTVGCIQKKEEDKDEGERERETYRGKIGTH
jgi:hypothetical protein